MQRTRCMRLCLYIYISIILSVRYLVRVFVCVCPLHVYTVDKTTGMVVVVERKQRGMRLSVRAC